MGQCSRSLRWIHLVLLLTAVTNSSEGCDDGYYGDKCTSRCPDNCENNVCDKPRGTCTDGCQTGFSGTYCSKPCPWTCFNNACDERTGTCSEGCEDGYYGTACHSKCYAQCLACQKDSENCQLCKVGYYGSSCRRQCPGTCKGKTCRQDTGVCTQGCIAGYYGETCSGQCSEGCETCEGESQCSECQKGFYLRNGSCEHCPAKCETCSGSSNCWSCMDGYYRSGGQCNACREPCTRCTELTTCSQCRSGHYLRGSRCIMCEPRCISCTEHYKCTKCHDGYYLANNNWCYDCSTNCLSCQTSYRCSNCKPGHYGKRCGRRCPNNCMGSSCDKQSGQCVVQCGDGFYGQNCDRPCRSGCKTCTWPAACTQCKPGYPGNICCPQNCTDGQCSATVDCSLGCNNDTDRGDCQFPCPVNCLSCNQSTEECLICMSGLYGTDCSSQCSDGCSLTEGLLVCNVEDGTCTNGCSLQAKRGPQCTEECNAHCVDKKCNQFTGRCKHGCEAGFYGNTCSNKCSSNCANGRCFEVNSTCIEGCNGGFRGHDCLEADARTGDEDKVSIEAVVGAATAGVVIVTAVVVIILLLCKRRRGTRREVDNGDELGSTNDGNDATIRPAGSQQQQHQAIDTQSDSHEYVNVDQEMRVNPFIEGAAQHPLAGEYEALQETAMTEAMYSAIDRTSHVYECVAEADNESETNDARRKWKKKKTKH